MNAPRRFLQGGLSLVELMIVLVITSIIILGATQLFSTLNAVGKRNMTLSRNLETARTVLDMVGNSARLSGYSDCRRGGATAARGNGKPGILVDNAGNVIGSEDPGANVTIPITAVVKNEAKASPLLSYVSGSGTSLVQGLSFFHYVKDTATGALNVVDKGNEKIRTCDDHPVRLRAVTVTVCPDSKGLETICWQENGGVEGAAIVFKYQNDRGLGQSAKPIVDSSTGQRVILERITFIHVNPKGENKTVTSNRPRGVARLIETTWDPSAQPLGSLTAANLKLLDQKVLYNTVALRIKITVTDDPAGHAPEPNTISRGYEATYALPNRVYDLYGAGIDEGGGTDSDPNNSSEDGGIGNAPS